ncbi:hypothetical protein QYF36_002387 [Acer negundo]|nr:hypothetical protein QYF36_002387 [Acer negundo]
MVLLIFKTVTFFSTGNSETAAKRTDFASNSTALHRAALAVARRSLTVWLFYARCFAAACCWATAGWIFWFEGEEVLLAGCALLP